MKPNREINGAIFGRDRAQALFVNEFGNGITLHETSGSELANLAAVSISILTIGIGVFWLHQKRSSLVQHSRLLVYLEQGAPFS